MNAEKKDGNKPLKDITSFAKCYLGADKLFLWLCTLSFAVCLTDLNLLHCLKRVNMLGVNVVHKIYYTLQQMDLLKYLYKMNLIHMFCEEWNTVG